MASLFLIATSKGERDSDTLCVGEGERLSRVELVLGRAIAISRLGNLYAIASAGGDDLPRLGFPIAKAINFG